MHALKLCLPARRGQPHFSRLREHEEWRCWVWKSLSQCLLLCAQWLFIVQSGGQNHRRWGRKCKSGMALESLCQNEKTVRGPSLATDLKDLSSTIHTWRRSVVMRQTQKIFKTWSHAAMFLLLLGVWFFILRKGNSDKMYTMEWKQKHPRFVENNY